MTPPKEPPFAALPPEKLKYKDYFEWHEPVKSIPSHRLLAIRRGSAEEVLMFKIAPPVMPTRSPNSKSIFLQSNSRALRNR